MKFGHDFGMLSVVPFFDLEFGLEDDESGLVKSADLLTPSESDADSSAPDGNV